MVNRSIISYSDGLECANLPNRASCSENLILLVIGTYDTGIGNIDVRNSGFGYSHY